ncbi:MAG: nuclear transport factor 2 family protein [Lysobacterales bacterium]|jgi:ketosteroid isomerase-like protein
MTDANDPIAVADRFIDALNVADEAGVRAVYHPAARIWHNFDDKVQTVDENIETMKFVHGKLNNLNYDVTKRIAFPGGFVQQHILRGTLASGDPFALHACAICQVEDGRITELEEYLDTAQARALFA